MFSNGTKGAHFGLFGCCSQKQAEAGGQGGAGGCIMI